MVRWRIIIGLILLVVGTLLIVQHAMIYGLMFDRNDIIGHDWLGLLAIIISLFLLAMRAKNAKPM